jgi:hypothetical protein
MDSILQCFVYNIDPVHSRLTFECSDANTRRSVKTQHQSISTDCQDSTPVYEYRLARPGPQLRCERAQTHAPTHRNTCGLRTRSLRSSPALLLVPSEAR